MGAGCERCERREGVVTVEVQAWCAASVVWRVMREKKKKKKRKKKRKRESAREREVC